jgi:hypothetical protein
MTEGYDSGHAQEIVLHGVQTGSGAHPASYPCVPRPLSQKIIQPERKTDHSPLSSTEVNNI